MKREEKKQFSIYSKVRDEIETLINLKSERNMEKKSHYTLCVEGEGRDWRHAEDNGGWEAAQGRALVHWIKIFSTGKVLFQCVKIIYWRQFATKDEIF